MEEFKRVEHIGLAVSDLQASIETWTQILGQAPYHREIVAHEKVETVFFKTGETKLELLGATSEDSVIQKFIAKKGEGIHHIALEVQDIYATMERLKSQGFTLLNPEPKRGADNKLICFVHPKDTKGVLLELCMEITNDKA
jgi:methylmalonyl-CoA/ethylmalonyl-CoA epimerase